MVSTTSSQTYESLNNLNRGPKQAVVIGGSIGALLAARALSNHFEQVTVIERDPRPTADQPHKGAPQGHHAHALLKSGENVLEKFFPGIIQSLGDKAQKTDFSADVRWFHHGAWKIRYDSQFYVSIQTRPALEDAVRSYVERIPNISFCYEASVEDLIVNDDTARVAGVLVRSGSAQKTDAIYADLVVDVGGRGSRTPQWLEKHGFAAPETTLVKIDLTYSSRTFEAPANRPTDWKLMIINGSAPAPTRASYIFPVGDKWLVTLAGYSGEKVPTDGDNFVEYTRGLARPDIYEAIKDLKPISDVKTYHYPAEQRRHYEKLTNFPAGLIVMGDAFCSLDPVFGQGMSATAKEALFLDELLTKDTQNGILNLTGFPQRFHKGLNSVLATPWLLATSEDFRFPKTEGKKPLGSVGMAVLHWYTGHIFSLSANDRQIHAAFARVMNLLAGPLPLFHPAIVFKVLRHAVQQALRRQSHTAADKPVGTFDRPATTA
jgi:2-polyprenyl-6-methoxyphenol hydroxylase-like FAD-dependent oxidoreductase